MPEPTFKSLCLSLCALVTVLAWAADGRAQERKSARLTYEAPRDLGCPEEQAFRDIVAARLGYDPFTPGAPLSVAASITVQPRALVGHVRVTDAAGELRGDRAIEGRPDDCQEVATTLAVAISIALDPLAVPQAAPEQASVTPPPVTRAAPPAPAPIRAVSAAPAPPLKKSRELALSTHAGMAVAFALTPGPALAPLLGLGLQIERWTVLVEGRVDLMPGTSTLESGDRLEASVYTAGPAGCLRGGFVMGCLGLELGAFQGHGLNVSDSRPQTSFFAAAGARAGLFVPLGRTVSLRILGELRVPFVRTSLSIEGASVWNAPALSGGARLELGASFF